MISCYIRGGLGNMMFLMAATKSIAIDRNTDCNFPNLRENLNLANNETFSNPTLNYAYEYLYFFNGFREENPNTDVIYRYPFNYEEKTMIGDNFIIDGLFQSEKYFIKNRKDILDFFKIPNMVEKFINIKYSNILKKRTTSLHIRRGDYIKLGFKHHNLPLSYYFEGIDMLKDKTDAFIVFSDDIPWCKENFIGNNFIFVSEKDYIELFLMSMCTNNIIANSSFSWWGAWLNKNEDKVVIGPKKWFTDDNLFNIVDLIPERWIKI